MSVLSPDAAGLAAAAVARADGQAIGIPHRHRVRAGCRSQPALRLAVRFWPGALTLVVPRRPDIDVDLGQDEPTVGLRCPNHPVPLALCRQVAEAFGQAIPVVLNGACGPFWRQLRTHTVTFCRKNARLGCHWPPVQWGDGPTAS